MMLLFSQLVKMAMSSNIAFLLELDQLLNIGLLWVNTLSIVSWQK